MRRRTQRKPSPGRTIGEALRAAGRRLARAGVESPAPAAAWLLSRIIGCARSELFLRREEPLPRGADRALAGQIARVAGGEPLQYVQGDTEFMGHVFAVDRRALIPRPETEQLVEAVLACNDLWERAPAVADAGTGSGCIVISLALAHPNGRYHATDSENAALELASHNARRHGVEACIRFTAGNLLEPLPPASLDAVLSNPPYVRTADWARLPPMIRDHEPRIALDGGADGLAVIRPLIAQSARVLKPGGRLFMEIGDDQGAAVAALLAAGGFVEIAVHPDLAGKDRIAAARRPASSPRIENCPTTANSHSQHRLATCRLARQGPEIGREKRAFPGQSPLPATQGRGGTTQDGSPACSVQRSADAMIYHVARLAGSPDLATPWERPPWRELAPGRIRHAMGKSPAHRPRVEFKMGYTDSDLALLFRVEDRYVRAVTPRNQGPVFRDSCVEFFFTPGPDPAAGYFNLEMNCGGVFLFHFQRAPRRDVTPLPARLCRKIKIAHSLPRIVRPEIRRRVTWTVAYRLPVDILEGHGPVTRPAPGVRWRANFYKCADCSSHPHWLTWAPVAFPRPQFHLPEHFGILEFR